MSSISMNRRKRTKNKCRMKKWQQKSKKTTNKRKKSSSQTTTNKIKKQVVSTTPEIKVEQNKDDAEVFYPFYTF